MPHVREDTVLDGSTCARQNPVISAGPDRWRCGGRLGRHAVSRVPVTSAPTIAHACNSSDRGSAFPRRAVLAHLRCVTRPKTPPTNNQNGWRGIKRSKSHKYHFPIPLVFRIKTIKIPGKSREMENTGERSSTIVSILSLRREGIRARRGVGEMSQVQEASDGQSWSDTVRLR